MNNALYSLSLDREAAIIGNMPILDYLRYRGLLTKEVFEGAVEGGHLNVCIWMTKYLYIPTHLELLAINYGHIHILEWLKSCGRMTDRKKLLDYAIDNGNAKIVDWILKGDIK